MKKCMFCLVVDDSHFFRNNDDVYAEIKTTNGKVIAPIVGVEGRTMEELKLAVNKTITEAFEKIQKKTKQVDQNSEVENFTTQVRWPMEW